MTSYQYWRGNIFIGEDNAISREEVKEIVTCPYCKAETDVIYERHVMEMQKNDEGEDLWVLRNGQFRIYCKLVSWAIGCPECIQEYERGEKGYYPAYGLDDYDEDMEIRINTRGTAYER